MPHCFWLKIAFYKNSQKLKHNLEYNLSLKYLVAILLIEKQEEKAGINEQ